MNVLLFCFLLFWFAASALHNIECDAYGATGWRYAIEVGKNLFGASMATAIAAWILL